MGYCEVPSSTPQFHAWPQSTPQYNSQRVNIIHQNYTNFHLSKHLTERLYRYFGNKWRESPRTVLNQFFMENNLSVWIAVTNDSNGYAYTMYMSDNILTGSISDMFGWVVINLFFHLHSSSIIPFSHQKYIFFDADFIYFIYGVSS